MRSEKQVAADIRNLQLAIEATRRPKVTIVCHNCRRDFPAYPSDAKNGRRFCSWGCRVAFMRGNNGANSGGGEWMRGEANPNWKHGQGTERQRHHATDGKVNQWRRRVYSRDRYQCRMCGLRPKRGYQLRAHHILSWAEFPELRFSISNGVTLCRDCHSFYHQKGDQN
jgi:5-methylcytosine-specific restriction endonuclease McrA